MILPLEQQLTSLEISKQMAELGFVQDSLWYWYCEEVADIPSEHGGSIHKWELAHFHEGNMPIFDDELEFYSAYTVAELLNMLPNCITKDETRKQCIVYNFKGLWNVDYCKNLFCGDVQTYDVHTSDALAKMLIHLNQNNLN